VLTPNITGTETSANADRLRLRKDKAQETANHKQTTSLPRRLEKFKASGNRFSKNVPQAVYYLFINKIHEEQMLRSGQSRSTAKRRGRVAVTSGV
jgi:hypothetical protein